MGQRTFLSVRVVFPPRSPNEGSGLQTGDPQKTAPLDPETTSAVAEDVSCWCQFSVRNRVYTSKHCFNGQVQLFVDSSTSEAFFALTVLFTVGWDPRTVECCSFFIPGSSELGKLFKCFHVPGSSSATMIFSISCGQHVAWLYAKKNLFDPSMKIQVILWSQMSEATHSFFPNSCRVLCQHDALDLYIMIYLDLGTVCHTICQM